MTINCEKHQWTLIYASKTLGKEMCGACITEVIDKLSRVEALLTVDAVEQYLGNLKWAGEGSHDTEKALVCGNIRGFSAFVRHQMETA